MGLGQRVRDAKNVSNEELIDQLVNVRSREAVVGSTIITSDFMAEEQHDHYPGALRIPAAMRELVRRGPAVIPVLLEHLGDARATHVIVGDTAKKGTRHVLGENWYRSTAFGQEYEPRVYVPTPPRQGPYFPQYVERPFRGAYVVKVGDICYALMGQIVNRFLVLMAEHEDIAMVVNSPVEMPALAAKVRADWGVGDPAVLLQASLLADIREDRYGNDAAYAMVRLRFYFPEAYRQLSGRDLEKRLAFERFEAVVRQNR